MRLLVKLDAAVGGDSLSRAVMNCLAGAAEFARVIRPK